ncbi:hypothetical protein Aph01nite_77940 [Acrocarpospora phusangensis]|uniref:DUF4388 domain-containing protein n=1 Tax=Acrocarpospora phusangensis TaxID=1070424 RepID=A0A919QJW9_9ACTN|nr:hypothetical protein [Acrocarpospora phusangensis]GIH29484.1 hypothetical protein Aph01nite_77940 [Acrocarpospora phusangensis]
MNGQHPTGLSTPSTDSLDDLGPVGRMLREHGRARLSGVLRISGSPGGTVFLRDGLIVAASTPASPGPESLLLRSGRVSEEAWNLAFTAGAPSGHLAAELIAQSAIGAAGLEIVCLSAIFDAVYAMELFGVEDGEPENTGPQGLLPPLPVLPGIDADRLVRDLSRRMAMTAAWQQIGVYPQCRPVALRQLSEPLLPAEKIRHDVLQKCNGRRTPRDIAFALGQGLYVIMQEIASLAESGLLEPNEGSRKQAGTVSAEDPSKASGPPGLPQRRRGASKVGHVLPPSSNRPLLGPRIPPDLAVRPEPDQES